MPESFDGAAKPGYDLAFADDFDGPALDTRRWLPVYLPQWSTRERSAPRYALAGGALNLRIDADQQPWCPEFDGHNRCSSIQTGVFAGPPGSPLGQHRFNPACRVREAQQPQRTFTPQYGYIELRARALIGPSNVVSLWMIGYEDQPERSGELAVMEIRGEHCAAGSTKVGYGLHPWGDPGLVDEFYVDELPIDVTEHHTYAMEWLPDRALFFVDGKHLRTIHQSPAYPMQLMLGIYDLAGPAELARRPADAQPSQFIIDAVRAYQRRDGAP
ncbi:MAG TPA: glycoside hydrolase family 16 protein, partial [Herpetosiphonaceae bacterium]